MVPRAGFPSNGSDDEWWGLSFVRAVPTRGSSPVTCLSTSFVLFLPSFWASVYCSKGVVVYSGYQSLSVMFYKSLHLWFVLWFVYEWKCHSYIINLIRIFFYHLCCHFISESFHIWRLDVLRCFHIKFETYVFSLTRMHFCAQCEIGNLILYFACGSPIAPASFVKYPISHLIYDATLPQTVSIMHDFQFSIVCKSLFYPWAHFSLL